MLRAIFDGARSLIASPPIYTEETTRRLIGEGTALFGINKLQEGIVKYNEALVELERLYPTIAHTLKVVCLNDIGVAYLQLNLATLAIERFESGLAMTDRLPADELNIRTDILMSLGTAYGLNGNHAKNIENSRAALETHQRLVHGDNKKTAQILHNIGMAYADNNDPTNALVYYRQSLAMRERLYPSNSHVEIVQSLHNITIELARQRNFGEALETEVRALSVLDALGVNENIEIRVNVQGTLGNCYALTEKHARARELFDTNLSFAMAKLGTDHPLTIEARGLLAKHVHFTASGGHTGAESARRTADQGKCLVM